jgi:nicotinamide-nucleotide amidase
MTAPDRSDPPIEAQVSDRLRTRGESVAVAESATGGLVGSLLTDVAGSSAYFDRSLVTYSNEAKQDLLAVTRESLDSDGAVSAPVASQMARGVRDTAGVTWGVATTGIAGPGGGTDEDPVGTVYIGIAYAAPWGSEASTIDSNRHEFDGDRQECKKQFAKQALRDLLARLQERV